MEIQDIIFYPESKFALEDIQSTFNAVPEQVKNSSWFPHAKSIAEMRHAAQNTPGLRICVFCMPKSGSSFVQTTILKTFQIPFSTLMVAKGGNFGSETGINPREQEFDELAIIQSNILSNSYVAQHHTRANPYLGTMLNNYGIIPFVTIRNIPDCLISFDDMMMKWLRNPDRKIQLHNTWFQTGGRFSFQYCELDQPERLAHIIDTWAKWYIEFFVSWKRMATTQVVRPIFIIYENDILNSGAGFVQKLTSVFNLSDEQKQRLIDHCQSPNKDSSRLNKGIKGRGQQAIAPEDLARIYRMAKPYDDELSDNEIQLLLGVDRDTMLCV